jgi:transposase InsO family protein/transposase-like protein
MGGTQTLLPRLPRAFAHPHTLSREARLRLNWIDHYVRHGSNASCTCRRFGISRDTFYRWWRRYDPLDLSTLEDRSRAPTARRESTTPIETQQLVLRLRDANPEWSKYKLAVVAARDHGVTVSASTVGRVLLRYGRINERRAARRRKAARNTRTRRPSDLVAKHAGDLVQVDTKHLYWPGGTKRFQFVAVDVATRIKVTEVYTTASSRSAAAFLATVIERLPFEVEAIQTDNGSEYMGEFHRAVAEAGIAHFFSYPHCPKHNAYVERQIQTEIDEFHSLVEPVLEVEEFNDLLVAWDRFFNEVRPHQSLGYLTPMAYFRRSEAPRPTTPGP